MEKAKLEKKIISSEEDLSSGLIYDLTGTLARWASLKIFNTKIAEERKAMNWSKEQKESWQQVKNVIYSDPDEMCFQTKYSEIFSIVLDYQTKIFCKKSAEKMLERQASKKSSNNIDHTNEQVFLRCCRSLLSYYRKSRDSFNFNEKCIMNTAIYYCRYYNKKYGTNFKPYYSRVNIKNIDRAAENERCLKYFKYMI